MPIEKFSLLIYSYLCRKGKLYIEIIENAIEKLLSKYFILKSTDIVKNKFCKEICDYFERIICIFKTI